MSELADESDALQANLDRLKNLSDSLKSFNESFDDGLAAGTWLATSGLSSLVLIANLLDYRHLQTRRLNWYSEEQVLFSILPPICTILTNNVHRGRCQGCSVCDTEPSNAIRRYRQDHNDRNNRARNDVCSQ
jgi:hypothetical protein